MTLLPSLQGPPKGQRIGSRLGSDRPNTQLQTEEETRGRGAGEVRELPLAKLLNQRFSHLLLVQVGPVLNPTEGHRG